MATKMIQLFITLEELVCLIKTLSIDLQLKVFIYQRNEKKITEITDISCNKFEDLQATQIFLGNSEISSAQIYADNIAAAKLGLIQITLPVISKNTMTISSIAVKTDWHDGLVKHENKDLVALFKKLKAFVSKKTFPNVWVKSIVTGTERLYSDIRYSEQAKVFYDSGGQLMQNGVKNLRFNIR